MKKHIETMVTAFRDGFQSYFGARVLTEDFLPAFEAAVVAGLGHIEIGGGARFQSLYFYCNEDAFAMMDKLRSIAGPNANLQTLARGINVVGLDSQSRDIIDMHARLFGRHGVSTIRNFDALNDVSNLVYSGERIVAAGLNHEVCVTMMGLPPGVEGAHTAEFYLSVLRKILNADIPYTSVCFKDASGTCPPSRVHDTIKGARKMLGDEVRIAFHSHETSGVSVAQYLGAIEAGATQVDCSLAPVSGGTSQLDIMTLWHALRGTEYDLGIDIDKIRDVEMTFTECMREYFFPPEALAVEPIIPFSPMPGGALTANTQMMRDNGIMDRYPEVIRAMGEVVAKGGFGTSVTPVSQFYFQQAFNNVMFGPWERIAEGYGKMVLGYFGHTPVPPDPDVVARAAEQLELTPTERDPIDINDEDPSKGVEAARTSLREAGLEESEESIFIAGTCKEKGIQFLKGEARVAVRKRAAEADGDSGGPRDGQAGAGGPKAAGKTAKPDGPRSYQVTVNGTRHSVRLQDGSAVVDGKSYRIDIATDGGTGNTPASALADAQGAPGAAVSDTGDGSDSAPNGMVHSIIAPLPGVILRIVAAPGASVSKGQSILVLESMKMETSIASPVDGVVEKLAVVQADQVKAGDLLARVTEA